MNLGVSLAHGPARQVADSGAKAHQALGGGHERLRRPVENGYYGRDEFGVRFKRTPVAPTIFQKRPFGEKTGRLPLDSQVLAPQTTTGTVQTGWRGDATCEPSPRSDSIRSEAL